MSSKITICIPVYNGANYIKCAIDSVLGQTYKNMSLVISDNCSTDETVSIVSEYLNDERITLIRQPHNMGGLNNWNDCLDKIKTDYFMFTCHDDCFVDETALEKGFRLLEENKNVPAVYCSTMFIDENGKPIMQRKAKFSGLTSGDMVARKSIISCRNLYGVPLLIRTSMIKDFRYAEGYYYTGDVYFSIFLSKGYPIYYVPQPLLAIRFHRDNNTARNYSKIIDEFKRMAIKYNIKLSKSELIQMQFNHWLTVIKKGLFYFYLDNIRR